MIPKCDELAVLIPAYKKKYINDIIGSLQSQILRPGHIIFSDDSPDGVYAKELESKGVHEILAPSVVLIVNGPKQGPVANVSYLTSLIPNGVKFIHLYCDDDIIFPDFYNFHINTHQSTNPSVTVSRRMICDDFGQIISRWRLPAEIEYSCYKIIRLTSDYVYSSVFKPKFGNWLGEFSNSIFEITAFQETFTFRLHGFLIFGLADIAGFLNASEKSGLVYLNENLGCFRISTAGHSSDSTGFMYSCAFLGRVPLYFVASKLGVISQNELIAFINEFLNDLRDIRQIGWAQDAWKTLHCNAVSESSCFDFVERFNIFWENHVLNGTVVSSSVSEVRVNKE